MHRSRLAPLAGLAAAALLVAACGGGGSSAAPASSASPAAGASGSSAAPAATRIEVSLTDALRIEPSTITVPAGVPVTFVVTNTGAMEHDFIVGDEDVQAEHEEEMAGGHGSGSDDNALTVPAGETKELTMTFEEPGTTLAGCHVTGHYGAGMKAEIVIE